MTPAEVPPGPLLLDTDVLSWIALEEGRSTEFADLLSGRRVFVSFVTLAEVGTLLEMGVLAEDRARALADGIEDYPTLDIQINDVVGEWAKLRAATTTVGTADDRERRQNDTWIAACALSIDPPLPIVTGNLRDFQVFAANSQLVLVHPDLPGEADELG